MIPDDKRFPWFPCEPEKLLGAMTGMSPDEQLIYVICLLRIYETGAPISDTVEVLSKRSCLKKNRVEVALRSLLSIPKKLRRTDDGKITNDVAEKTLETMAERRSYAVKTGRIGADVKWEKKNAAGTRRWNNLKEARERGTHTLEQWVDLVRFCGSKCLKCGNPSVTKDHIVAISAGGSDAIGNLQPLCFSCNASKGPSQDYRPDGWENAVFSKKQGKAPYAKIPETSGYLQREKQDSLFPNGNRPSEAAPAHTVDKLPFDPEADLFRRGKEVLGKSAGGMIAKLLAAKGSIAQARAAIEQASERQDPREYIGAMLRGRTQGTQTRNGMAALLGGMIQESHDDDSGGMRDVTPDADAVERRALRSEGRSGSDEHLERGLHARR